MQKLTALLVLLFLAVSCGSDSENAGAPVVADNVIRQLDSGTASFFQRTHLKCADNSNPFLDKVFGIAFHLSGVTSH
ncbi:MAG: hypothetical protein Fur0010_18360 [Bdellovibrio sp.]